MSVLPGEIFQCDVVAPNTALLLFLLVQCSYKFVFMLGIFEKLTRFIMYSVVPLSPSDVVE